MVVIKGITIQLKVKQAAGTDEFNHTVYEEAYIDVDNVLVGEPSSEEVTDTMNLYGKQVSYMLAIPKGDTNVWTDTEVVLPDPFSGTYRTIGTPTAGIEPMIPLDWNRKVRLEKYG